MESADKHERRVVDLIEFMSKHGTSAAVQPEILSSIVEQYTRDLKLTMLEVSIKNLGRPHEKP